VKDNHHDEKEMKEWYFPDACVPHRDTFAGISLSLLLGARVSKGGRQAEPSYPCVHESQLVWRSIHQQGVNPPPLFLPSRRHPLGQGALTLIDELGAH
jgi:hypothetical protein